MNEFQKRSQAILAPLIEASAPGFCFEFVRGQQENYLMGTFSLEQRKVTVFIYQDEIGYDVDGVWRILERQDYEGPDEILLEAAKQISSLIASLGREQ